MSGIRLSRKHGVNPSINVCFYCQKDKNEIILPGRMKDDVAAPMRAIWDKAPCDECEGFMEMGIIVISIRDGEGGQKDPYRTGGWIVLKDEAIERLREIISPPELIDEILESRVFFLEDKVWKAFGYPEIPKAEA